MAHRVLLLVHVLYARPVLFLERLREQNFWGFRFPLLNSLFFDSPGVIIRQQDSNVEPSLWKKIFFRMACSRATIPVALLRIVNTPLYGAYIGTRKLNSNIESKHSPWSVWLLVNCSSSAPSSLSQTIESPASHDSCGDVERREASRAAKRNELSAPIEKAFLKASKVVFYGSRFIRVLLRTKTLAQSTYVQSIIYENYKHALVAILVVEFLALCWSEKIREPQVFPEKKCKERNILNLRLISNSYIRTSNSSLRRTTEDSYFQQNCE